MAVDDAASHALYASGQKNTKANRTGARTVIDALIASGLLENENGSLRVATPTEPTPQDEVSPVDEQPGMPLQVVEPSTPTPQANGVPSARTTFTTVPSIAINIQLHLPETENPAVYEELFKALRKHLLSPTDGE